jgi:hypothetical protein
MERLAPEGTPGNLQRRDVHGVERDFNAKAQSRKDLAHKQEGPTFFPCSAIAKNHAIPTRFSCHRFARTPQAEDKVRGMFVQKMKKCLSDYSPDNHSPDFILGISLRALVAARRAGAWRPCVEILDRAVFIFMTPSF